MADSASHPTDTAALARQLGLSRWSVSRALNDQPGISEITRSRVREAVTKAGFEPSFHARGLRGTSGGAGVVGLVLPTFRDPVWLTLAGGLCEGLVIRGWQPDWGFPAAGGVGGSTPPDWWTRAASRRYAAVVVLGAEGPPPDAGTNPPPAWLELRRRGVPVIFVEPAWAAEEESDELTTVRFDHRAAAALVAGHLHAAGHRLVGLRGFHGSGFASRVCALKSACDGRGITCEPEESAVEPDHRPPGRGPRQVGHPPFFPHPPQGAASSRPSRRARSVSAVNPTTALIAADDLTALRALCEHRAAGRTVPRDGSVIGYGDDPAGALSFPALTTVDPQRSHLVARTLELLDELWRDPGNVRAGRIWIAPLLRCRGSVADVPARPEA